ncbi:hypothetical protein AB4615_11865 [Vibrio splendidus]
MLNKIKNKILRTVHSLLYNSLKKKTKKFYLNNYEVDNRLVDKLLDDVLKCAISNVPYYHGYTADLGSFPVVDKSIYQEVGEKQFLHINNMRVGYYKMNTGGSTGEPFEFYRDVRTGIVDNFHQEFQHKNMGFGDNDVLIVFNGCEISSNLTDNNIFWKKKNEKQLPFGSVEFSTHYLNRGNAQYYLDEILTIAPSYIRAYPSAMCELTIILCELGYTIRPFEVKGIQLSSEVCSDAQKEMLIKYWGDVIYFQYGHSEAAAIASSYPNETGYVFSPYYGLVEILDDDGVHVGQGETGKIVVTSFHNFARPMIRYDTGDMAVFDETHKHVTRVKQIIGREQDFVIDKSENKISVTSLIFGQHFKAFKNIINWQVVNRSPGKLQVRIIKGENWTISDTQEIKEKLSFNNSFDVEVVFLLEIEKTKSGKNKLVVGF